MKSVQACGNYIVYARISLSDKHNAMVRSRHVTNLGDQDEEKSFPRGTQIFLTMSNSFKLCPTQFSRGGD